MNLHLIAQKLNGYEGLSLLEESINLYEKFRIKDGQKEGEDSLLFQWGIFDWGEGEHFEIDVTRQLAPDNRDEIQHLHTTLLFEISNEL